MDTIIVKTKIDKCLIGLFLYSRSNEKFKTNNNKCKGKINNIIKLHARLLFWGYSNIRSRSRGGRGAECIFQFLLTHGSRV